MPMENLTFVKNGSPLRLPPGFRFHPTDEELLLQYLFKKALSSPLPAAVHIPDAHVCRFDPWDLPGDLEQERYFFSCKEAKYCNGRRSNRATDSGYWRASGIDKRIVSSKENCLIGFKKTLVFYTGNPKPNASNSKTHWIMHEYHLVAGASASQPPPPSAVNRNWVLCRIFSKKRSTRDRDRDQKKKKEKDICNDSIFHQFLRTRNQTDLNLAPCSSSSGSSGVTQIPVNNQEQEQEETSSCNSFRTRS